MAIAVLIRFIIKAEPLGIFVALVIFSLAVVIILIGIDESVRRKE